MLCRGVDRIGLPPGIGDERLMMFNIEMQILVHVCRGGE